MSNIGILILFAIVAAVACAKAGSAGGSLLFAAVALVLFVATPAGSGLPGAVADFVRSVNDAATPALNRQTSAPAAPTPTAGGVRG